MTRERKNDVLKIAPENMSIHMLIGEISKITNVTIHKKSEMLGLPQGYRSIIFHLAHNDGITQLELSKLTRLKPPTVSVSLQKMELDGLVTRIADKDDLRKTIVSLTDKGKEIVKSITEVFECYDKAITETLTASEAEQLKSLLIKVRESIISESEENSSI